MYINPLKLPLARRCYIALHFRGSRPFAAIAHNLGGLKLIVGFRLLLLRFCLLHSLWFRVRLRPLFRFRLWFCLLRDAVGSGDLARWDRPGVGEDTQDDEADGDEQNEEDDGGPLSLLQAPVEAEESNDDVGAHEEEQKLRDTVAKEVDQRENTGPTHPTGKQVKDCQHDEVGDDFVGRRRLHRHVAGGGLQAGETVRVLVDRRPGQRAGVANDVAVDQVADTPENLTGGGENDTCIDQYERVDALDMGAPEQHGNDQEDGSEEGHAALPRRQNAPGLENVILPQVWLLNHEVEPSANQPRDDTPPEQAVEQISVDTLSSGIAANGPQANQDTHHVHQPVPVQRQRANLRENGVNVNIDIGRADPQPAPINDIRQDGNHAHNNAPFRTKHISFVLPL